MKLSICDLRFITLFFYLMALGACGGGGGSVEEPATATNTAPAITKAQAPSRHYVDLTFSQPVSSEAGDKSAYRIIDNDGQVLGIEDVHLSGDRLQAVLTTQAQQDKSYVLNATLKGSEDTAAERIDTSISFEGQIRYEAYVSTATPLDNTTVLVTFSEEMDLSSAQNTQFYRILATDNAQPANVIADLAILTATLSEDETTVTLTTAPQSAIEYTLEVTNVFLHDSEDKRINPFLNSVPIK